jgi:hypothetical protein
LYISANTTVIAAKLTRTSSVCRSHATCSNAPPHHFAKAASAALKYQQHKRNADHEAEGQHAAAQEAPQSARSFENRRLPDAIEVALQLREDRRRPDREQRYTDQGCEGAFPGAACSLDHISHRGCAVSPQKSGELGIDVRTRGVPSEEQPGNGDNDDQQGRN